MESEQGSSVTLVFYRARNKWWKEPALNILAMTAQMSNLTHCEIAIGEEPGQRGLMTNVCRVFNDSVGVELVERTGKNPQNIYLQLGCSKNAERRMLYFSKTCVGKPFSNIGMARSLLWPRQTDNTSFFCAELVAAILKEGGLMDAASNPGSATPQMLHNLYKNRAAATANPCLLREMQSASHMYAPVASRDAAEQESFLAQRVMMQFSNISTATPASAFNETRRRPHSPPRGKFKVVSQRVAPTKPTPSAAIANHRQGLQLTLHSLDMSKR